MNAKTQEAIDMIVDAHARYHLGPIELRKLLVHAHRLGEIDAEMALHAARIAELTDEFNCKETTQ